MKKLNFDFLNDLISWLMGWFLSWRNEFWEKMLGLSRSRSFEKSERKEKHIESRQWNNRETTNKIIL